MIIINELQLKRFSTVQLKKFAGSLCFTPSHPFLPLGFCSPSCSPPYTSITTSVIHHLSRTCLEGPALQLNKPILWSTICQGQPHQGSALQLNNQQSILSSTNCPGWPLEGDLSPDIFSAEEYVEDLRLPPSWSFHSQAAKSLLNNALLLANSIPPSEGIFL